MLQSLDDVLVGPMVSLRPMREDDAESVVRWRNDPDIARWLFSSGSITVESHLDWFRRRGEDRLDYTICLSESGLPVGTVNYTDIDLENRSAFVGKMVGDRAQWGRGLSREAYRLWIPFGFNRVGLESIFGMAMVENRRALAPSERMGFRIHKEMPNHFRRGDELVDVVIVQLTRENARKAGVLDVG